MAETVGMAASPESFPALILPAIAGLVVTVGLAFLVVRFARRGSNHMERERARRLENILRAFLGGSRDMRALWRAAREADDRSFWVAIENLAAGPDPPLRQRLGEVLERNRHVADERRALRDDSPWRRELAARRLGLLPSVRTRRALRRAMVRGPEPVTLAAAQSLGRLRDRRALHWVLKHPESLARRTPRSRVAVLRGFGRGGLPIITAALDRGVADPKMERAMIETLGLGGRREATAVIERRLAADDVDVRVAAVRALGRIGGPACAPSLIPRLADPEWPVRAQAARALGTTGDPAAIEPLAARLTDRAWWVRRHAAYALLALGEAGTAALRGIARHSPDPYARDIATEALGGGFPASAA